MIEEVKSSTVLELNELVKALEEEFGVSAAAMAAPLLVPPLLSRRRGRLRFDVVLAEIGSEKIRSSRLSVRSPVWVWPRLRLWSRLPPRLSRRVSPRRMPRL